MKNSKLTEYNIIEHNLYNILAYNSISEILSVNCVQIEMCAIGTQQRIRM